MRRLPLLHLALCVCAPLGPAEAATVQHAEPLRGYRVGNGGAAKPAAHEPTVLSFNAFSRDFALELEPNGRLAALEPAAQEAGRAYRGRVADRPGSWARVVLTDAGPSGLVFDGDTFYGIEAAADASAAPGAGAPVMFRLADVYFAPGELGCEIGAVAIDGEQAIAAMAEELTVLAAEGATLNLDLGAVADFEFSQAFGPSTETALLTRLNNVDGIYSEQLGIQITVRHVDIFTSSDDPFTASAANELLDELATYRGATPSQDAQGLTHLFTGRNLDGSTAGVAYFGAVCARRGSFDARSFGAALTEGTRGATIDSLVAAHEIGHNFGAPHDGDADGACASTPTLFLMAPSLNGSNQFSACSVEQMQAEVAAASCLAPLGPANMTVAWELPPDVLAGVSFTQAATVRNEGADAAAGVVFTATAEPGLTIVAAAAGGTSCMATAASATCELGAVGGGASRGATLTLRANESGEFDLTGTVAADSDADAGDDTATVTFTARPSVDLVLSGASLTAQLDVQTTINASIANSSDFGATSLALTGTASAGLRLEQVALGGTPCTIAAQSLSCPLQALAARGTLALSVAATGTAAGNQQLTLSVGASQAERTPADNQLSVAVNVAAPVEGGGGGASPWWLAALLLAARGLRGRLLGGRRRHT